MQRLRKGLTASRGGTELRLKPLDLRGRRLNHQLQQMLNFLGFLQGAAGGRARVW